MTLISVIMPVLDMADTIGQQLQALSRQTYGGDWELIVCDNGSTDRSRNICEEWRDLIPALRMVDASQRRGASAACNRGADQAHGSVFAFCDADDVAHPGWLEHHAAAARRHDHIAGALDAFSLNTFSLPAWEAQALHSPPHAMNFKPFAIGANMVVSRRAFTEVGGFCESLLVSQDLDFSWRVQLAGYPLYFEPRAIVAKRYRRDLRGACRQAMVWGMADLEIYRLYRRYGVEFPIGPGPLYSDSKAAFSRRSGRRVEVNGRTLVVALAHNAGRLLGCTGLARSIVGHGCEVNSPRSTGP